MVIVDTSVWVDFLRSGDSKLQSLLDKNQVMMHEFIIGELALGSMANRANILDLLGNLPLATACTNTEVMTMIDALNLQGRGIGFIDAHILGAARLTPEAKLWTRDKRLHKIAQDLAVSDTTLG